MTRLNLDEDVKPLSDFRSNVTACILQTRRTGRPPVITQHGKSAAVLLGVSEYEGLMQKMEVLEDIRRAESQLARKKGEGHELALKRLLSKVVQ